MWVSGSRVHREELLSQFKGSIRKHLFRLWGAANAERWPVGAGPCRPGGAASGRP